MVKPFCGKISRVNRGSHKGWPPKMWDVTGRLGVSLRSESSFWDVLAQNCLHLGLYSYLFFFSASVWGVTTWEFQILTLSSHTARGIQVRYKELFAKEDVLNTLSQGSR